MKSTLSKTISFSLFFVGTLIISGCYHQQQPSDKTKVFEEVATSSAQWTGLAVSKSDRLFVNYPRWSDNVPVSVAEIINGKPIPYPSMEKNTWRTGLDPANHFICVQAVFIDNKNSLWVLDPANPQFKGVVPGGPKLVQINLTTNNIVRTYRFNSSIAPQKSYLNDVRIDTVHNFAYMTDSEGGALVALNLATGEAKRFLQDHPSTKAEDIVLTIDEKKWLQNGKTPKVHSDGIAFDQSNDVIYYQALTGRTMYSIPASVLRNFSLSPKEVSAHVMKVGKTGAADGLFFGTNGKIYISALEKDAILRTSPNGDVETVVQSSKISWPDSFSIGPNSMLYFTTSRIHEGATPKAPYGIYRFKIQ